MELIKFLRGVLLLVPLFFISCGINHNNQVKTSIKVLNSYVVSLDKLPSNNLNAFNGFYKLVEIDEKIIFYFFDWNDKKIYLIDLFNDELYQTIDLSSINNIQFNNRVDVNINNKNQIAVFSDSDQLLTMVDFNGNVIQQIITSGMYNNHPFVTVSFGPVSMKYDNYDNSYLTQIAFIDIILRNKGKFKEYFKRPMFAKIELDNDSISLIEFDLPYNYLQGKYYGTTDIYTAIDLNGNLIFSYPPEDSLYIYKKGNNNLLSKYCSVGEIGDVGEYDIAKLQDFSYLRKYHIEEGNFKNLIINEFDSTYYRIFEIGKEYLNSDGLITDFTSTPWGVVKMDSKLNFMEKLYFEDSVYGNKAFLPIKDEILISRKFKGISNMLEFDLIKIL